MRNLNKKQKTKISEWIEETWTGCGSVCTIDQMPHDQALNILALNDHETFWQNADRYINDKVLEKLYQ